MTIHAKDVTNEDIIDGGAKNTTVHIYSHQLSMIFVPPKFLFFTCMHPRMHAYIAFPCDVYLYGTVQPLLLIFLTGG